MLLSGIIDRLENEFAGRWLINYKRERDLDISLTAGTIRLSNLQFNTAELKSFAPPLTPRLLWVGSLVIELPFLRRTPKATASDVSALLTADFDALPEEELRRALSAQVYVVFALQQMAAAAAAAAAGAKGGGGGVEIKPGALDTAFNMLQNLEVRIQRVHVRLEDANEVAYALPPPPPPPPPLLPLPPPQPPFALGLLVGEVVLLPEDVDGRNAMEVFRSRCNTSAAARIRSASASVADSSSSGDAKAEGAAAAGAAPGHGLESGESRAAGRAAAAAAATVAEAAGTGAEATAAAAKEVEISKFVSLSDASMYFCRDVFLSREPVAAALARLRLAFTSPPTALPPLLRPVSWGAALRVTLSKEVLGVVNAMHVSAVAGAVAFEAGDEQAEVALRWFTRLRSYPTRLQATCLRPLRTRYIATDASAAAAASSYPRALWRHAIALVRLRLEATCRAADDQLLDEAAAAAAAAAKNVATNMAGKGEGGESASQAEAAILPPLQAAALARRWRRRLREWAACGRYVAIRTLLGNFVTVEKFRDPLGNSHDELHETLMLPTNDAGGERRRNESSRAPAKTRSRSPIPYPGPAPPSADAATTVAAAAGGQQAPAAAAAGDAWQPTRYLLPEELPVDGVARARRLVWATCLGSQPTELSAPTLRALWALQLELDAALPRQMAGAARLLASQRAEWRLHMAEVASDQLRKVEKLGLDGATAATIAAEARPAAAAATDGALGAAAGDGSVQGGGSGASGGGISGLSAADRIGTLLVRVQQASGVSTLLGASPDAFATITVEESSASASDLERRKTRKASYDSKTQRCFWGETFRFAVELDEAYARAMLARRRRRPLSGFPDLEAAAAGTLECNSSFLLQCHVKDMGIFVDDDLGSCTLSGSTLTRTANRVCEHTAALFLPPTDRSEILRRRRRDAPPVQLTILTAFVPPGDDAAAAERELASVGNRQAAEQVAADKLKAAAASGTLAAVPGGAAAAAAATTLASVPSPQPEVGASTSAVVDLEDLFAPRGTGGIRTVSAVAAERGVPVWRVSQPRSLAVKAELAGLSLRVYLNGSRARRTALAAAASAPAMAPAAEAASVAIAASSAASTGGSTPRARSDTAAGETAAAAAAAAAAVAAAAAAATAAHGKESLVLLVETAATAVHAEAAVDAVAGSLAASAGAGSLEFRDHRAPPASSGSHNRHQPMLCVGALRVTAAVDTPCDGDAASAAADGGSASATGSSSVNTQLDRFWRWDTPLLALPWNYKVQLGAYEVALAPGQPLPEHTMTEVWRSARAIFGSADLRGGGPHAGSFWQPLSAWRGITIDTTGALKEIFAMLPLPRHSVLLGIRMDAARERNASVAAASEADDSSGRRRSNGDAGTSRGPLETADVPRSVLVARVAELERELKVLRQHLSHSQQQEQGGLRPEIRPILHKKGVAATPGAHSRPL